jgi:formylglycine-generating enzyme required for sulfatase activity
MLKEVRGGGWRPDAVGRHGALRNTYYPSFRIAYLRLRCVLVNGPVAVALRTFRGGRWPVDDARYRVADRDFYAPDVRCGSLGFRCVKEK